MRTPVPELGELFKLFGTISSGVYTPTLTNVSNIDASTARQCHWIRVKDMVLVAGTFDIDPTVTATSTTLGISLPITSDFTAALTDCAGTAANAFSPGLCGGVAADATNNRAQLGFISTDVTNSGWWFIFLYRIL